MSRTAGCQRPEAGEVQLSCALCRGEVYAGEFYYNLDGRVVCEACLGRYARRYFALQRRRLPRMGREVL